MKTLRGPFTALGWALALAALMTIDGPTRPLAVMGCGFVALGLGWAGADLEERLPWIGAPLAVLIAPLVPLARLLMEVWYGGHGDLETSLRAALEGAPFLAVLLPVALLGAWKDKIALALLLLAPALALDPLDPIRDRPDSIVLITVDSLRKDAGEGMDSYVRLAEHGTAYTDATAASTWTLPALASLHTGSAPATHQAGRVGEDWLELRPMDRGVQTLAEHLAAEGLDTAAIVTNPFVGYGLEMGFGHWRNLSARAPHEPIGLGLAGRGFDLRSIPRSPGDAYRVVEETFRWLDHGDGDPVFLWVHFLDPHLPYHHVPGFEELEVRDLRQGRLRPEAQADVVEAYQREVDLVDREIMRLLDGLDERLDDAVVILTADHGEEFWEEGGVEHGHAASDEVIDIPLVVRQKSTGPGEVVRSPVSQVDLLPTVLAMLELEPPELDGVPFGTRRTARPVEGTLYGPDRAGTVERGVDAIGTDASGGSAPPGGLEALGYMD